MIAALKVGAALLASPLFKAGPLSGAELASQLAVAENVRAAMPREGLLQRHGRRLATQFSRRPQRSPDREASVRRRRAWGGDGNLPNTIRHHYTEGERAALAVIGHEVKRHGACCLPIDRIAAVAGVSRTTVQNAIRHARALGHISVEDRPRPGAKNLTNIVRIVAPEWLVWLKRGGDAASSTGFKALNPTKNSDHSKASALASVRSNSGVAMHGCGLKGLGEREKWVSPRSKQRGAQR